MLNTFLKVFLVVNQITLTFLAISMDRHLEEIKFISSFCEHDRKFIIELQEQQEQKEKQENQEQN